MPTPSDNHGFDLGYEAGDDWTYNMEFEDLEWKLPVRDLEGNLADYTPHDGATFVATDTGAVYEGDGSSWSKADRDVAALDADELTGSYTEHIRVLSDSGVVANVSLSETDPLQTALDQSHEGDVLVFPPGASWEEAGPVYPRRHQTWYTRGAQMTITGDAGGLVFDGNAYGDGYSYVDFFSINGDFHISGLGPDSGQGGYAVHHQSGVADGGCYGMLRVEGWDGTAWYEADGAASYQNNWSYLHFFDVDAGDDDGVIYSNGGGAPDNVGFIAAYPSAAGSASDSTILNAVTGPGWNIGIMNIGGAAGRVINADLGSKHGIHVDHINFEPDNQQAAASSLVYSNGRNPVSVGNFTMYTGTTDYIYDSWNTDNNFWGPILVDQGTVNNNYVNVRNAIDSGATAYYAGESTDVDNGNGGRGLACLSDLTLAT